MGERIEWKDATSYSQGQRGKIEPNSFEAKVCGVTVWVSRGHRYYPEFWVMNCHILDIKESVVGASSWTAEAAQVEALRLAAKAARDLARKLTNFAIAAHEEAPDA